MTTKFIDSKSVSIKELKIKKNISKGKIRPEPHYDVLSYYRKSRFVLIQPLDSFTTSVMLFHFFLLLFFINSFMTEAVII